MKKRILSIFLVIAGLLSLSAVPAFAAAENGYVQDFNNVGNTTLVEKWEHFSDGAWVSTTPVPPLVGGLGGRAADDKSLKLTNSVYFANNFSMAGKQVLEFDVLFPGENISASEYKSFRFTVKGVVINNEILHKSGAYSQNRWDTKVVDPNLWNHFAYEFDLEAKTYNLYINGVKLKTDASVPASIANNSTVEFRFLSYNATDDYPIYLDDVKLSAGSYDASKAAVSLGAAAGVSGISVDEAKKTITTSKFAVSDAASKFAVNGGSFSGVVDASTHMTKTSGDIENGDLIAVCAADGVTYAYYTVNLLETKSFSQDFTNVTHKENDWTTIASGEYLCPGVIVTGISGKAADDKSVDLPKSGAYYRKDVTPYGKTTIEYSLLNRDTTNCFMGKDGYNLWLVFGKSNQIYSKGGDSTDEDVVGKYDVGKWYRVAFELDVSSQKYNAYVNGRKLIDNADMPERYGAIAAGGSNQLRFQGYSYVDDVKVSSGAYTAPALATISAADSSKAIVNAQNKTVLLKDTVAVSEIASALTVSDGGVVSVVDSATYMTKTSGNVSTGDWIAVRSADGVTFDYYTVIPEASVSDILILNGETEVTGNSVVAGELCAAVDINYTDSAKPYMAQLVIASYDEKGALADVKLAPIAISVADGAYVSNRYTTEAVTITDASSRSVKAFLWSDLEGIQPVKSSRSLDAKVDF